MMGMKKKKGGNMKSSLYPKRWMTINELVNEGFGSRELKQWVHVKGFPAMKGKASNSPWKIDTQLLDAWLIKKGIMKRPDSDLLKIKDASL